MNNASSVSRRRGSKGLARIATAWLGFSLSLFAGCVAAAAPDTTVPSSLRFGILPIGSAAESLQQWRRLLDDLQAQLNLPVTTVSVSSYTGLSGAIDAQRVDVAFLSGRLAVEAVAHQHMRVFAQFVRSDGARGNVALLVVRDDSPIHSLDGMLAKPGQCRYARGEPLSVTGFVMPETYVFAPRGINSDTFFASVRIGGHQANLLSVVNREVDVATSNNPDLDLFRRKFPSEASQLKVIWRSSLIPSGVLVVREGLAAPLRRKLADFILAYGSAPGATGAIQRATLARIPDLGGFAPQDNHVLLPFVDMQYALLRQQAEYGQWVSPQAKQARLAQIEQDHRRDAREFLAH